MVYVLQYDWKAKIQIWLAMAFIAQIDSSSLFSV